MVQDTREAQLFFVCDENKDFWLEEICVDIINCTFKCFGLFETSCLRNKCY